MVAAQNGGGGNSVGVEDSLTEKTNLSSAFIVFGIFLFSTFVLSQYLFSTL